MLVNAIQCHYMDESDREIFNNVSFCALKSEEIAGFVLFLG